MQIGGGDPLTTQSLPPGSQNVLASHGHSHTYLSSSILNQSQKEQFKIVEHNIWIRLCQMQLFYQVSFSMACARRRFCALPGSVGAAVMRSSCSTAPRVQSDETTGQREPFTSLLLLHSGPLIISDHQSFGWPNKQDYPLPELVKSKLYGDPISGWQ